jgi:TRAP-type uncharacterized transport system substrate-binding protein
MRQFNQRSLRDIAVALGPSLILFTIAMIFVYLFINPAPPSKVVISAGDGEGDYVNFAKQYQEILKRDGVNLEIRSSSGASENLKRLQDEKSDVDVGFVQDGLGSPDEAIDLVSLGSLYYEPIWVFYRGPKILTRGSELLGHRIAIGRAGSGTANLVIQFLKANGVTAKNSEFVSLGMQEGAGALSRGEVDTAFFLAPADNPLVAKLVSDTSLQLMSFDQAEALSRQLPYLHHLILPHGVLNLQANLPPQDIHLLAPTATLLIRDSLHPALVFLLLKAASQVHGEPGIFEHKGEFPIDKDAQFPLSDEAKQFYKSGAPFWQKYLPYWLATFLDRFLFVILPLLALVLPMFKMVPKIYAWRIRTRIYRRYGELKFLETQIKPNADTDLQSSYLHQLDEIEERVNHMKVPLDYTDHLYVLREHIDFVRNRLRRGAS